MGRRNDQRGRHEGGTWGRLALALNLALAASCHGATGAHAQTHSSNFYCTMGNERMKLDVGDYDLPPEATYIVGVKELSSKGDLLHAMAVAHGGWSPRYEYATMSMFSGSLSPDQVDWLLRDDRVAYVECDGFVKVARKRRGEL
mmetsp:Transcript_11627/g.35368  ORF Transcript_11627/g.35368 Transcript_11627/m.35368 type:complete len:144 (-) Transcript_11627:1808-2239(-)